MKLKGGDILLFKGRNLISKIIEWGTNSPYSHVAICVSPGMNLAIESVIGGGVRARDIRQITTKYDVYRVKETYEYNLDGVISFLVWNLNRKYDYLGVFYLALLKLFRLKNRANIFQKEHDYFCSELCHESFLIGGRLNICPHVSSSDIVSPADISHSTVIYRVIF